MEVLQVHAGMEWAQRAEQSQGEPCQPFCPAFSIHFPGDQTYCQEVRCVCKSVSELTGGSQIVLKKC